MKPRNLVAALMIMLCAATASGPASADGGGEDPENATRHQQRSTELQGGLQSGGEPEPSSRTWDEFLREISGPATQAELDAAIEATKENSSVADYYPDAPNRSVLNPAVPRSGDDPAQGNE